MPSKGLDIARIPTTSDSENDTFANFPIASPTVSPCSRVMYPPVGRCKPVMAKQPQPAYSRNVNNNIIISEDTDSNETSPSASVCASLSSSLSFSSSLGMGGLASHVAPTPSNTPIFSPAFMNRAGRNNLPPIPSDDTLTERLKRIEIDGVLVAGEGVRRWKADYEEQEESENNESAQDDRQGDGDSPELQIAKDLNI